MARIGVVLLLLLTLGSCPTGPQEPAALTARFVHTHEYETLCRLLGHLRLGMAQWQVESLLGKPDYSPIAGQYYYHTSDRITEEGTPIGLVVDYRRTDVRSGREITAGKLESFWLGPIGE